MIVSSLMRARKLIACLTDPALRPAAMQGVFAGVEHLPMLRMLQPRTVLDIGANRGQFSLACLSAAPVSRIEQFEPLAGPALRLQQLFGDRSEVTLHHCALGAARGEAQINVTARDDSSSLLKIGARQTALFDTRTTGAETIALRRLDDEVDLTGAEHPVLLKADVQGFELEVLKGALETLKAVDFVYVECSFAALYEGQALAGEVVEFLGRAGFRLRGVYNLTEAADAEPIQADLLFGRTTPLA